MTNLTGNSKKGVRCVLSRKRAKVPEFPLALELLTTLGLALMAGFLFNMSVVTAPALNALSPEQALVAWKGINSTVRNPLIAGTAFGTAPFVVACAIAAWRSQLGIGA